tara:strand:+ start:1005 stop:1973 length:969 start_codon:yes stop_codon:yes gene_type:complete
MKNENTNTLSENATLVRLTTKFWSGIKTDKSLRDNLADITNTSDESLLHVAKHLVGFNANKYFRRIINKVRNDSYYPLTLPWDDNSSDDDNKVVSGWRLCPNSQLDNLQKAVDQARQDFFKEVDEFCKNYPNMIIDAKEVLGHAFNMGDYPPVDDIKDKFKFDFEISLIPSYSNDIRLNVSADLRKRIEQDAEKRLSKNVKTIFQTTVDALVEQVEHISEKLKSYDPTNRKGGFFKDSSFDKLRKAVEVIPNVNQDVLGNDIDIANAHQSLVAVLSTINSIDSLRDETDIGDAKRKKVADDLDKAIDPLKGGLMKKLGGKDD